MHTIKVDMKYFGDKVHLTCPYCSSDQWAPAGIASYVHVCVEAGPIYIMNGHMFVDVPGYMYDEKLSTTTH